MKYKTGITVFTPTYNRQDTLERLYLSLKQQNNKNFEWLIVDDGSTDKTKKIIEQYEKEKKIEIQYIYQENHGKSYAYNVGVQNAKYNLFFCVDSDDYISIDAIENLNNINNIIKNNDEITGIMAYKKNMKGNKNKRKTIKKEYLNVATLYRKYHFKDEIALIYKTEMLQSNLFPIIEGEKFIPESYIYDRLDNYGNLYFLKKEIYLYEYLADGYTSNTAILLKKNIKGYLLYTKQRLLISKLLLNKIKGAIQYNIACNIAKKRWDTDIKKEKILLFITWFPAYIFYIRKYKKLD